MENPSVTVKHTEMNLLTGWTLIWVIMGAIVTATREAEDRWAGWLIIGFLLLGCVALSIHARSSETIDARGITLKTVFSERTYPWKDILEIGVGLTPAGKRGERPVLIVILPGGRSRMETAELWSPGIRYCKNEFSLDYTQQVVDCIRHYYGELSYKDWGKPPVI